MEIGERLCLACGMCCDGSLFDTVRLEDTEERADLRALGLPVKLSRAKQPVAYFQQPCRALCGDLTCRVYANRPNHCRSFECQVFKDVVSGDRSLESGVRLVRKARRKAKAVRELLRKAGEEDEALSLSKRFRRVQRWIENGSADERVAEVFSELGLAAHQFDLLAHDKFYTMEEES